MSACVALTTNICLGLCRSVKGRKKQVCQIPLRGDVLHKAARNLSFRQQRRARV